MGGAQIAAGGGDGGAQRNAEARPAEADQVAGGGEEEKGGGKNGLVAEDAGVGPVVGDVDGATGRVGLEVHEFFAAEAPDGGADEGGEGGGEEPAGDVERPAVVVERQSVSVRQIPAEGEAGGEAGEQDERGLAHLPGREEQAAEGGHEEHADEHGSADGEGLGEGERDEEAAGLVGEGEEGEKTDDGGGGGGEERAGDLVGARDDGGGDFLVPRRGRHGAVFAPALRLQVEKVLGDVLRHDDAEIHHHADGDDDAGEAHEVGAHAEEVHDEKREQHAERQADGGGEAGAQV